MQIYRKTDVFCLYLYCTYQVDIYRIIHQNGNFFKGNNFKDWS